MEGFQKWWSGVVTAVLEFIAHGFETIYNGIAYNWNTSIFVFGMGFALIGGLIALWRRRA